MASVDSRKPCPHGLSCPVRDVAKHAGLFHHELIEEDGNPGLSRSFVPTALKHVSEAKLDMEDSDAPGGHGKRSGSKRRCPKGKQCQMRSVAKHEELFFHEDVSNEDEMGPGSSQKNVSEEADPGT